jgi:peptide deformylase
MAIRPILTLPDPLLRRQSTPVEQIDERIRTLVADMFETMYDAPGIGLAAIQIGVPKRVVVLDVSSKKDDEDPAPLVLINPRITWSSDDVRAYQEGCLSIPEYYEDVERPDRVRVAFLDHDGAERQIEADGLLATAIQHEIDHLDGVLFIDHLSRLKRERVVKKFAKAARRDSEERAADA